MGFTSDRFPGPYPRTGQAGARAEVGPDVGRYRRGGAGFRGERCVDRHGCVRLYAGGGPRGLFGRWFPLIYDCVGNQSSLAQSLGFSSPRGRIVVIGCVAEFKKLDLTFVWARELRIRGAVGYGLETWRGERRHTFEIAHDLLLETGAPVQNMVTHAYPFDQYRDALRAAANHRKSGAVKVVLQP